MYKRRIIAFLGIIVLVLLGLVFRLAQIQIVRGRDYLDDAMRYLSAPEMLPAVRGKILDRNGIILAMDEPTYDLCMDYRLITARVEWISERARVEALKSPAFRPAAKWLGYHKRRIRRERNCTLIEAETVLAEQLQQTWQLARRVGFEAGVGLSDSVERVVKRVNRLSRDGQRNIRELYQLHPVVRGLKSDEAIAIKADMAGMIGVAIRATNTRYYPRHASACHVVGLLLPVNKSDQDKHNTAEDEPSRLQWRRDNYLDSDLIGKTGVEKMCESVLRGRRGYRIQRGGRVVEDVPAEPGRDVHLTIDIALQEALAEAFINRTTMGTGSIVVLEVPRAEVLAVVSIPRYDANAYRSDFSRLVGDTIRLPLRSRAVSQAYAPGSTVKPVAAMGALTAGLITPATEFTCNGYFDLNPTAGPKCWIAKYNTGHGTLNLVEGIRHSCNVYFDHVGNVMGPARLSQWYKRFGFGETVGMGLPEETGGVVATDEWMLASVHRRRMRQADAWQMAIGQGAFSATPLQVANAMATLARGGVFISPMLSLEGGPQRIRRDLHVSPAHTRVIHQGMREVVHHTEGTAHRTLVAAGLNELGVEFCGKTGTAQVPPQVIDTDGDGKADATVRTGEVAWFAGFVPHDSPQIAFVVMVEYVEGGAAKNAGPIALDVVRTCMAFGYLK